jgi:predicted nucleic acid-binding protein
MPLLISDSNIFIDLISGDLMDFMFKLPEEFAVPNILYKEELADQHSDLPGYGLRVFEIKSEFMMEAFRLRNMYKGPGQNDLFALALAKQENCPLITGDKQLRLAAKTEKVEIKGTLWLVERMINEKIITVERAKSAFDAMQQDQRRLPWGQVKKLLNKYAK